jgi:predicted O-methyltransferase YrrM
MWVPRLKGKPELKFPDSKQKVQNSFLTYAYYSSDDFVANDFLISIVNGAINYASANRIDYSGSKEISDVINIFPGEHYRLLRALSSVLKSQLAIEVGTFRGYGSLALLNSLTTSRVVTYDVIKYPPDHLSVDFSNLDGQIESRVINLIDEIDFASQTKTLSECDFIFIDGPKDGIFEYLLLDRLASVRYFRPKILVLDDIKFMNMIPLWRSIRNPKLDISSFGHWSGTGLVDVREGLKIS